jgi:hypothetical protein
MVLVRSFPSSSYFPRLVADSLPSYRSSCAAKPQQNARSAEAATTTTSRVWSVFLSCHSLGDRTHSLHCTAKSQAKKEKDKMDRKKQLFVFFSFSCLRFH